MNALFKLLMRQEDTPLRKMINDYMTVIQAIDNGLCVNRLKQCELDRQSKEYFFVNTRMDDECGQWHDEKSHEDLFFQHQSLQLLSQLVLMGHQQLPSIPEMKMALCEKMIDQDFKDERTKQCVKSFIALHLDAQGEQTVGNESIGHGLISGRAESQGQGARGEVIRSMLGVLIGRPNDLIDEYKCFLFNHCFTQYVEQPHNTDALRTMLSVVLGLNPNVPRFKLRQVLKTIQQCCQACQFLGAELLQKARCNCSLFQRANSIFTTIQQVNTWFSKRDQYDASTQLPFELLSVFYAALSCTRPERVPTCSYEWEDFYKDKLREDTATFSILYNIVSTIDMEEWKTLDCRNNEVMMNFLSNHLSYLERVQSKADRSDNDRMGKITDLFTSASFIDEVRRLWLQRASYLRIALVSHPSLAEDSVTTVFARDLSSC